MNTKISMEPCSAPAQANRIAEGISDLIRVWADAATDLTVGSTRIMASTIENVSQSSCGVGQRASNAAERESGSRSNEGRAPDVCTGFSESVSICTGGTTQLSGLSVRSAEPACATLTQICRPLTDACDTGARGNASAAKTQTGSGSTAAATPEPAGEEEITTNPVAPTKDEKPK